MGEALTNGLTEAALRAFVHQELDFKKKKKALGDAHKAMRGHVKTFGVDLEDFDSAVKQLLADDGGELFVAKLAGKHKLMQMLGLEVARRFRAGDQLELPLPKDEKKNDVSKAYRAGASAHLDGKQESDVPHSPNSVEGQDWISGFRYSEALCNKGAADIKILEKGENPDNPEAAKGTLPARAPKPLEAYAGKAVPAKTEQKPKKPAPAKQATGSPKPASKKAATPKRKK